MSPLFRRLAALVALAGLAAIATAVIASSTPPAGADEATSSPQHSVLYLRVPHALPLFGTEHMLKARITYHGDTAQAATVTFRYRHTDGTGAIGSPHHIQLVPGQTTVVEQSWTPGATGQYTIITRLQPHEPDRWAAPRVATQTVTVVKRPLHFHYWDSNPDLACITAAMVNEQEILDYWADRGVIALQWAGGICDLSKRGGISNADNNTLDSIAQNWVNPYREGFPGIVIDEFGSGGEVNQFLGRALVKARELEPKSYFAVYCVSVGDAQVVESLRHAADLVLVEAYEGRAAYAYSWIKGRTQTAVDRGLANKTLVALGIGDSWISTAQELRRQLHFTRYTFPEMPGVAFFGSNRALTPALNELLRQFYIGPVLRVATSPEDGACRVEVRNIGTADASSAQVHLQTEDQPPKTIELHVPPLAVNRTYVARIAEQHAQPITEYRERCPILGPPLLWDKEPPQMRPNATTPWPTPGAVTIAAADSFDAEPPLEFEYDTSGKEGYDGNVSAASYALPPTHSRACELRFDLRLVRNSFYGGISLALEDHNGQSQAKLRLWRSDHQPGVYMTVSLCNDDGVTAHESPALIIAPDTGYRIKLVYHPQGYVRFAISDESGTPLWDTGEIPTYGPMQFDRLRFGVESGDGCSLEWNDQQRAMFLRGMSPNSSYVISGYLDNVEFIVFQ